MHAMSDRDLVLAATAGDRIAYGQLVERYQCLVCAVTFGITRDAGSSEDLAQETFLAAWTRLSQLRDWRTFRPWLCGIARNLSLLALRNRTRDVAASAAPLDTVIKDPVAASSPRDEAISREERALLWEVIDRIPEPYRVPLVLYYREGRSIERVAAILGLHPNAVKQRLFRARKMIRDEVAGRVEMALERTRPKRKLAPCVLAALPPARLPGMVGATGIVGKLVSGFTAAPIPWAAGAMAGVLLLAGVSLSFLSGESTAKDATNPPQAANNVSPVNSGPSPDNPATNTESTSHADDANAVPPASAATTVDLEATSARKTRIELAKAALREGWRQQPMKAASAIAIKGWTYLAVLGDPEGKERLMNVVRSLDEHCQTANRHMLVYLNDYTANEYLDGIRRNPRLPLETRIKASEGMLGGRFTPGRTWPVPDAIEIYYREQVVLSGFALTPMRILAGAATESSRSFLGDIAAWTFDGLTVNARDPDGGYARRWRPGDEASGVDNACFAQEAIRALVRVGNTDSIVLLRDIAVDSPSPVLRRSALQALVELADESFAIEHLREAVVTEQDLSERIAYAYQLAVSGDDSYMDTIYAALDHSEQPVRVQAYVALCELGDPAFIEPAVADFQSNGEPAGYWEIQRADQRRMGFALQGSSGYMSEVLFDYLWKLATEGRTPEAETFGLGGLLSGSDEQLRHVVPFVQNVLHDVSRVVSTGDPFERQMYRLLILLRAGSDEIQEKALAQVERLYEQNPNSRGDIIFFTRCARNPRLGPFFARVIEETPNAHERLMAATWLLANEARVLPE